MEKIIILLLLISGLNVHAQTYKKKYKNMLEPNSKLVRSGFNYTVEKMDDTTYVFKRYYPENKMITCQAIYKSDRFDTLHGGYIDRYDDGKVVNKGVYQNNKKVGEWLENATEKGNYKNGKREGKWVRLDFKERIIKESSYKFGELIGKQIHFDTLGQLKYEEILDKGDLISTTQDTTNRGLESMPRFSGCEAMEGSNEDKKMCADKKMLEFIYKRIKYPKKARIQQVEGTAIVRFVIDRDGEVTDIKVLRGLTKEIGQECLNLIKKMPTWRPGMVKGKPVKVQFLLPIKFRLN